FDMFDTKGYEYEWWYKAVTIPRESDVFIRIYFSVEKLYIYNVTLRDIVSAIYRGESNDKVLKIVESPIEYGFIDVFPIIDNDNKLSETVKTISEECKDNSVLKNSIKLFQDDIDVDKSPYSVRYAIQATFLNNIFKDS